MDDQDQLPEESEAPQDEDAQETDPESDPGASTNPLPKGRMGAAKPSGDRPAPKTGN